MSLTGPCSRPMAVLHMSVTPQRSMRQPSVRMFVSSGTWEGGRGGGGGGEKEDGGVGGSWKTEHEGRGERESGMELEEGM